MTWQNGAYYFEQFLLVDDYDDDEDSVYYKEDVTAWSSKVEASRAFRETASGSVYNYRNKVLMGLGQTRVLNEPPSVTDPYDVSFDLPNVDLPDTDEGIMMLSILEMQSLLRSGKITSSQLTEISIAMLQKYDAEYNMVEVPAYGASSLTCLSHRIATMHRPQQAPTTGLNTSPKHL